MANYNAFLFTGHGAGDPGAVGNGYKEHDVAVKINEAAKKHLASLNIHYNTTNQNNYKSNLTKGNSYTSKAGLTTHLNSSTNSSATGVEIIVANSNADLTADFALVSGISKLLGITNRGVKSRNYDTEETYTRTNGKAVNAKDYYGEIRSAKSNGFNLAILEVAFISNSNDIKKVNVNIEAIGKLIAEYIASKCNVKITQLQASAAVSQSNQYVDGCTCKILNGAVYGGLSSARGTKVPNQYIGTESVITKFQINNGSYDGLVKSINSWIPINYLQVVSNGIIHTVVKGDTLYSISKKYSVKIDYIKSLNKLKNDMILIGQKIKISAV